MRSAMTEELPWAMLAKGRRGPAQGLLRGLHQGGLQGVFEQHRHGARHFQLLGGDGLVALVAGQLDAADALAQVFQIARQRQNGHQLGGGDDEAIRALDTIGSAAWPRVRWRSARSFMSRVRGQRMLAGSISSRAGRFWR
jgi:hypothetical protein